MSTYIGVSHQYKVEAADGTVLTAYVQNLGADEAPQQGETVTLSWKPEHTFAVDPAGGAVDGGGRRMTDDRIEPHARAVPRR